MKRYTLAAILLAALTAGAQPKNGETLADIRFTTLVNAPMKTANLSQFKGKVVLLDFWATWCGGCIQSMPHLQALQTRFGNKLQAILITQETEKRTRLFLEAKPSKLWFAVDTPGTISDLFPHRFIPHTVLIGPDGKLIAATNPEAVTASVIDSVLRGQAVHLPPKIDNLASGDELIATYFGAADTVKNRFLMQAEIKGGPGMSTTWLDKPAFAGRRFTAINVSLTNLYRIAFGDFPYGRTIDETRESQKAPRYCVDLIVSDPAQLRLTLRKELAQRFDLQAKTTSVPKEVLLLKLVDPAKFARIPRNTSGKRTYFAMHGKIDQESMTMRDFAAFLETFGLDKGLVVDETGSSEKLDIKFSFQPEDPNSIPAILADMGLKLETSRKDVEILVLYKN